MKKYHYINGYVLLYKPDHPRAFKEYESGHQGYVYEHILVAEKILGRALKEKEVVHHLDLDRSNNNPENLLIMDRDQHPRLHIWINKGCPILGDKKLSDKDLHKIDIHENKKHKQYEISSIRRCVVCDFPLGDTQASCSWQCNMERRGSALVNSGLTKDGLTSLLSKNSWVSVGKMYNMSDNGIRKWAKKLGVDPKQFKYGKPSIKRRFTIKLNNRR